MHLSLEREELGRGRGVHRTDIQVRFGDTDALGHVNNASYAQYAEAARLDFLTHLGQHVGAIILAHLAIDYRRPVEFGEAMTVETRVERLGRSSITLRQLVTASGGLAAEIRSVVVHFDYESRQSRELPAALRERLSAYMTAPPESEG